MAAHVSEAGNSLNPRRRGGQMAHHGGDVCGLFCVLGDDLMLPFIIYEPCTSLLGAFGSTGLSYMVAPRRTRVRDLSCSDLPLVKSYSTVRSCSPTRACTGELLAVVA